MVISIYVIKPRKVVINAYVMIEMVINVYVMIEDFVMVKAKKSGDQCLCKGAN